MIIYILGIGYHDAWNGYCESSYFWPLAICVTEKLKQQLPNEHFIDNCNPGYKTYPWYKHPFGGCQCVCFPE